MKRIAILAAAVVLGFAWSSSSAMAQTTFAGPVVQPAVVASPAVITPAAYRYGAYYRPYGAYYRPYGAYYRPYVAPYRPYYGGYQPYGTYYRPYAAPVLSPVLLWASGLCGLWLTFSKEDTPQSVV